MANDQQRPIPKIDVHHHIFLPQLGKHKADQNARVGWKTPRENLPWDLKKSLHAMDQLGVAGAVLSYPAGVPESLVSSPFQEHDNGNSECKSEDERRRRNRAVVRELNVHAKGLCDNAQANGRFGWFACLPDLRDVEGTLLEVAHVFDVLRADGVSLSSSYGTGSEGVYIGDDAFDLIWDELDKRRSTVFVHGTQTPSSLPHPHAVLGLPVVEVPNETFKAAAHLVVTGKKRRYPNVNIILAHCGGSALCLAPRVAGLSAHMGCQLFPDECLADFGTFFVETALSGHSTVLSLAEQTVGKSRILFGTDFPAVSLKTAGWYTKQLEEFYERHPTALEQVASGTAVKLFPRFASVVVERGMFSAK